MIRENKRIEIIDYFRGLSILGVVFYHLISIYMTSLPMIIKYAANVGSSGVLIFFFCSGFSLHYVYRRKQPNFFDFIKNKIKKIYIPYIGIILVSAVIPVMDVSEGGNRIIAILSHVFQFRIFSKMYFSVFGGHWWYLGTLFQFYLLFFLMEKILRKIGGTKYGILCVAISCGYVISIAILGLESNVVLSRLCLKYFMEFGLGMVVAERYLDKQLEKHNVVQPIVLVTGLLGVVLLGVSSKTAIGRLLNDIPGFFGIICLFYWSYKLNVKWFHKGILWISKISFEWYMTHMMVFSCIFWFSDATLQMDFICAVCALVISCLVAIAYQKLIKVMNK